MIHLIDKDTLVAEIEKLISNGQIKLQESQECSDYESNVAWSEYIATCRKILSFIDTFEVKEVDLEKEYKEFVEKDPVYNMLVNGIVGKAIAKHFFELGLKAQKGK